jgi:cardiolipin synthase
VFLSNNGTGDGGEKEGADGRSLLQNWLTQLKSPPNIITSTRILCTPILSHLIISEQYELALYGCLMAGASDALDGFLARHLNMKTVLGSYLDPLADKALINVLAVSLWYVHILPAPLVLLWGLRDVGLVVGSYLHVQQNTSQGKWVIDPVTTPLQVQPTTISKVNTALQFLTLSVALIQPVYGTDPMIVESLR